MRRPAMVAAGVGAIGAVGVLGTAVRRAASDSDRRTTTLAVTVTAPIEDVRRAWDQHRAGLHLPASVDIRPAPADRGAEVRVPAGDGETGDGRGDGDPAGAPIAEVRDALRRFKAIVECGEAVNTDGQPTGRSAGEEARTRAVTDRLRAWSPA
jgi:hypothetical protein